MGTYFASIVLKGRNKEPPLAALHAGGESQILSRFMCDNLKDERGMYTERTTGGRQKMVFVTEPGLYDIILSCRQARIHGTAAHAFKRWVTHEVLPTLRKDREYRLQEQIAHKTLEEKGRRLWNFVKELDIWSFNARRKHFGRVCQATKSLCYLDEYNSPHVKPECLDEAGRMVRSTMSKAIIKCLPENQKLITQYFQK